MCIYSSARTDESDDRAVPVASGPRDLGVAALTTDRHSLEYAPHCTSTTLATDVVADRPAAVVADATIRPQRPSTPRSLRGRPSGVRSVSLGGSSVRASCTHQGRWLRSFDDTT